MKGNLIHSKAAYTALYPYRLHFRFDLEYFPPPYLLLFLKLYQNLSKGYLSTYNYQSALSLPHQNLRALQSFRKE